MRLTTIRFFIALAAFGLGAMLASINAQEPSPSEEHGTSLSPDKRWQYKCEETYSARQIVKAGTTEAVLDLGEELELKDGCQQEVVWAPDSKRFAFNHHPMAPAHWHPWRVALFQVSGDKWTQLRVPMPYDKKANRSELAQVAKKHLPKGVDPEPFILKVRSWPDPNTALLVARYPRSSDHPDAALLLTLKFDVAGKWKIVKTHQMSTKELEEER